MGGVRMSDSKGSSGGIRFVGLLTIVFVVLKLTGVIDWSWWWVISPSLISLGVWIVLVALVAWIRVKEEQAMKDQPLFVRRMVEMERRKQGRKP